MKAGSVGSRFPNTLLTFGVAESTLISSKQLQPAMTKSLYTISIKSRKPTDFINALVSPMHCEFADQFGWLSIRKDQNAIQREDKSPTPDSLDQKGLPGRERISTRDTFLGKWG